MAFKAVTIPVFTNSDQRNFGVNITMAKSSMVLVVLALLANGVTAHETVNGKSGKTEPTTKLVAKSNAPVHCEVPCGIYSDQMRFEMMLEDTKTIAKAITSLNEMTDGFSEGPPNAKTINQMTRWVNTKETHATNTQHIIAQYFMTQRIKSDKENYAKQLAAAHKVMVCSMKCKQDAAAATAVELKAAILDFYRAYTGKEPKLEGDHK